MTESRIMVITGARKGIGKYLATYYLERGHRVVGCSRGNSTISHQNYAHFNLDVADEPEVKKMFFRLRSDYGEIHVLINNAGTASMNHFLLTPTSTVQAILRTNVLGLFLVSREAAKLMRKSQSGRIVNIGSAAVPLKMEGEAVYAASKAAVVSLTEIMAREAAPFGITVNAVGPAHVPTDMNRSVPPEKIQQVLERQAIPREGGFADISNVIDFFIKPESDFITGQVVYLGGV